MLFENISYLDKNFETKKAFIGIRDGIIAYIGEKKPEADFGEKFDGAGYLLVPGLVSAHSHNAMTLLRGIGGDKPLQAWLTESIFPEEAKLKPRDIYNGTLAGCAEMLKYGVVSSNDMYFSLSSMAEAYRDAHLKANICLSVTSFDPEKHLRDIPQYGELEAARELLAGDSRLMLDCCVHSEYANTVRVTAEVIEYAAEHGMGMHIHLSETASETEDCISRHGCTPAEYFDKLGAFEGRCIAAHCVTCTDSDYALLADKGVYIASCPTSNLKLGSGIPDYRKMSASGANICLGTDGVASNNNLNMIKEVKLMALLAKGLSRDASACPAKKALASATTNGWRSQGRMSGVIAVGYPADLAVFDISSVNTAKSRDGADTLVYACDGEAYMTLCDGEVLYRNGEYTTIDKEKLCYEIAG